MTLKQVTHSIHSELLSYSSDIKRSHCRELIAAYFNYQTMVSLENDGFFHNSPNKLFNLDDFEFEYGEEEQLDYKFDDDFDDEIQTDNEQTKSIFLNRCSQLAPLIESDAIKTITENSLNNAKLYFVTYDELCNEIEYMVEFPRCEGNSYWYEQLLAGQELSKNQLMFANEYKSQLQTLEELKQLIFIAASKNHEQAIYLSTQLFNTKEQKIMNLKKLAEKGYVQAAIDLYQEFNLDEYLIQAAKLGDRESLEELVSSFSEKPDFLEDNRFNAHYYNFLAILHGYNLTDSSYEAIGDPSYGWNNNGSNDDYYGPLYADGFDGIELPTLDEESMLLAKEKAQNDFNILVTN